jgi:hypothetical protein
VLDVVFDEDRSRIRLGESPENFSLIRQLAFFILNQDKSKSCLTSKRFRAASTMTFASLSFNFSCDSPAASGQGYRIKIQMVSHEPFRPLLTQPIRFSGSDRR